MSGVRLSSRRKRKQWWKPFASPKVMIFAVPAMWIPLAILVFYDPDQAQTGIDRALGELPIAGASDADPASMMGASKAGITPTSAMRLYASSARVKAAEMNQAGSDRDANGGATYFDTQYDALHPRSHGDEDYMIGSLALLYETPSLFGVGLQLFQEYCSARPEDAAYTADVSKLPMDPGFRSALINFAGSDAGRGLCPRLG